MKIDIALSGKSGSGKTTVAEYLISSHNYILCTTGLACRTICQLLLGSESKTLLNRVTDAIRTVDEDFWIRIALKKAEMDFPIVFDSIRFRNDYYYLRSRGFQVWRIEAPVEVRVNRLRARGQEFNPSIDDFHSAEVELEDCEFDYRLVNDHIDLTRLHNLIDIGLINAGTKE